MFKVHTRSNVSIGDDLSVCVNEVFADLVHDGYLVITGDSQDLEDTSSRGVAFFPEFKLWEIRVDKILVALKMTE